MDEERGHTSHAPPRPVIPAITIGRSAAPQYVDGLGQPVGRASPVQNVFASSIPPFLPTVHSEYSLRDELTPRSELSGQHLAQHSLSSGSVDPDYIDPLSSGLADYDYLIQQESPLPASLVPHDASSSPHASPSWSDTDAGSPFASPRGQTNAALRRPDEGGLAHELGPMAISSGSSDNRAPNRARGFTRIELSISGPRLDDVRMELDGVEMSEKSLERLSGPIVTEEDVGSDQSVVLRAHQPLSAAAGRGPTRMSRFTNSNDPAELEEAEAARKEMAERQVRDREEAARRGEREAMIEEVKRQAELMKKKVEELKGHVVTRTESASARRAVRAASGSSLASVPEEVQQAEDRSMSHFWDQSLDDSVRISSASSHGRRARGRLQFPKSFGLKSRGFRPREHVIQYQGSTQESKQIRMHSRMWLNSWHSKDALGVWQLSRTPFVFPGQHFNVDFLTQRDIHLDKIGERPMAFPTPDPTQPASGLLWQVVNCDSRPSTGEELINEDLAQALRSKTKFTQEEFDAFKVECLRMDHFIKSGSCFFQPARVKLAHRMYADPQPGQLRPGARHSDRYGAPSPRKLKFGKNQDWHANEKCPDAGNAPLCMTNSTRPCEFVMSIRGLDPFDPLAVRSRLCKLLPGFRQDEILLYPSLLQGDHDLVAYIHFSSEQDLHIALDRCRRIGLRAGRASLQELCRIDSLSSDDAYAPSGATVSGHRRAGRRPASARIVSAESRKLAQDPPVNLLAATGFCQKTKRPSTATTVMSKSTVLPESHSTYPASPRALDTTGGSGGGLRKALASPKAKRRDLLAHKNTFAEQQMKKMQKQWGMALHNAL